MYELIPLSSASKPHKPPLCELIDCKSAPASPQQATAARTKQTSLRRGDQSRQNAYDNFLTLAA